MFYLKKNIQCPISYNKIPLSTPLEDLSFIVFDTETTGFQVATTDRLIEIGAVPLKGFNVQEENTFQTYVNPKRQISREITELTSITNEKVVGAPLSFEAITSFFDYIQSWETVCLVGHYVSFDTLVLKSELKREKFNLKNLFTIDTLDLIGFLAPSFDMRDLERYAMAFGTRIYDRHSAKGDALTTAYLFQELLLQFRDRGFKTLGELMKATDSQVRTLQF
ncbi:exonuclease domain-containing protein [Bacillus sp. 31A1R]|uniref:Exonuclease domain-containing protein n=1 Tax=Robertmurraya mangrovi TaxID=3098077 RepID=A0ABU5IXJ6_9BACI|nr:exonuclease domain-containing protein [Bacillus sp. 31A1R]MDZ5471841.1 exonuclease domain-containing protein [Bacillus sp. 31A1R]